MSSAALLILPILESREETQKAALLLLVGTSVAHTAGGTSGEGGSGAFRVWTQSRFLDVSTRSSSSKAKVLDLSSNSVRKESGWFQDDLIPDSEIITLFSCAVASLLLRTAGHM